MENEKAYPFLDERNTREWTGAGETFTVWAEYDDSVRGRYFKDDWCENWSVKPGAKASYYRIDGRIGRRFSSAEEAVLYLYINEKPGFALELIMN